MADLALSTVHVLLSVIRKEGELLAGVRGDVQFIRDEMESINGLLRHLAGSKERASDHQVRAWIKQVMELAYDSNNCVERYAGTRPRRRKGFVGRLRRVVRVPKSMWIRYRVATRIRQLKIRAREVGERQQRYGVAVPPKAADGVAAIADGRNILLQYSSAPRKIGGGVRDVSRQAAAIESESGTGHMLKEFTKELIEWLDRSIPDGGGRATFRAVAIVAVDGANGTTLANKVYEHYQRASATARADPFDCVVRIGVRQPPIHVEIMADMLRELLKPTTAAEEEELGLGLGEAQLKEKLVDFVRAKKLLVVLADVNYLPISVMIKALLDTFDCSPGSAVVFSTKDSVVAANFPPTKTVFYSHVDFHHKKASLFLPRNNLTGAGEDDVVKKVLSRCDMDDYCTKLFLHALHSSPNRTPEELNGLSESLAPEHCSDAMEKRLRMAAFCYHGLSDPYKNCLWYTAAFIRGSYHVRRASLTRRWIAEGFIVRSGQPTVHEEAERCVEVLLSQRLLLPQIRSAVGGGKVKTCNVNPLVIEMVTGGGRRRTTTTTTTIASTVDDFLDTNHLPLDPDLHFSIRNGIRIRRLDVSTTAGTEPPPPPKKQMESVMEFLWKLPRSSRLCILRVLDLERCEGLTKRHLSNICKIRKLRYLSLRGCTDVAQLPKKLHQLELLETLDIRQTKVQSFEAALPKSLKNLLAGRTDCPGKDAKTIKSRESFSTVRMPGGVPAGEMDKLEILSHITVTDSGRELANIGKKLKELRKLGVVLFGGGRANLKHLFDQINELDGCLRSLSIRMEPIGSWGATEAVLMKPPKNLESLRICGVRDWLPRRIKELDNLAKLTLRDTLLNEDAMGTLGSLKGLRCLRLRYHSFDAGTLTFSSGHFPNLEDLVLEDDLVGTITFAAGAAPKLAKIVWSFQRMESMTGVKNLGSLKTIQLNRPAGGNVDGYLQLQQDIKDHPNKPKLDCEPPFNQTDDDQADHTGAAPS
uniref:Uncharacterized protein n=1 Tax=Leersia perrieri TaxID=77586 RepID=A0A0D9XUV4_9ORYZ